MLLFEAGGVSGFPERGRTCEDVRVAELPQEVAEARCRQENLRGAPVPGHTRVNARAVAVCEASATLFLFLKVFRVRMSAHRSAQIAGCFCA